MRKRQIKGIMDCPEGISEQQICDQILKRVTNGIIESDPIRTGLYLLSRNAGMACSVRFWKRALEETPAFMSPQEFPWTLSNAPAAYLARKMKIHGPCFTLVGDETQMNELERIAKFDIDAGIVNQAYVVRVDFPGSVQYVSYDWRIYTQKKVAIVSI